MLLLCVWDRAETCTCSGNTGIVTCCRHHSVSGCPPLCPPGWNHARAVPLVHLSCGYIGYNNVTFLFNLLFINRPLSPQPNKGRKNPVK